MRIRKLHPDECELLKTFLYEAIFQRDGEPKFPFSVIEQPELSIYIENFGTRRGDYCLCAEEDGHVLGAVWTRIIPAYGHVDDETPEFSISVLPGYQGRGIGTALMRAMLDWLRAEGYAQASLSVQKENAALRMYRKLGFESVWENAEECIMVCRL